MEAVPVASQLAEAAQRCRDRGIHLFGDMPIFVAHDSADVWACPKRFMLDDEGKPAWVTGVPPDYFSENGQRWGNPHYDWDYHLQENFEWWLARLEHHFQWFDLVRIDHFLGLEAVWMIDAKEETAFNGHWQKVPGDALLAALKHRIDPLPLVAEDLGVITPEVRKLKEKYGLPGMAVLQFAFDAFEDNPTNPRISFPTAWPIRARMTTTPRWAGIRHYRKTHSSLSGICCTCSRKTTWWIR